MNRRCQLIQIHPKASVPRDIEHPLIRTPQLRSHGRAKPISHRSKPTGGNQCARFAKWVVQGCPHLVLSHFRRQNRLIARNLIDGAQNIVRVKTAVLHDAQRIFFLVFLNRPEPPAIVDGKILQSFVQRLKDGVQIPDHMVSGYHIFVHLRRIHIQMQNLGMFRKGGDIAHHPIAESGAGHDQQITVRHTHVGHFRAVHSDHTRKIRVIAGEPAKPHEAGSNGNLQSLGKFHDLPVRPGDHGAAAHVQKRLACASDHPHRFL